MSDNGIIIWVWLKIIETPNRWFPIEYDHSCGSFGILILSHCHISTNYIIYIYIYISYINYIIFYSDNGIYWTISEFLNCFFLNLRTATPRPKDSAAEVVHVQILDGPRSYVNDMWMGIFMGVYIYIYIYLLVIFHIATENQLKSTSMAMFNSHVFVTLVTHILHV